MYIRDAAGTSNSCTVFNPLIEVNTVQVAIYTTNLK